MTLSNHIQGRQIASYNFARWLLTVVLVLVSTTPSDAFSVAKTTTRGTTTTALSAMMHVPPPPVMVQAAPQTVATATTVSSSWMTHPPMAHITEQAPSTLLAIQEYKTPTKEELAEKKRNFNIIFWGGGFVAPFLATVFYFGFKFWEK